MTPKTKTKKRHKGRASDDAASDDAASDDAASEDAASEDAEPTSVPGVPRPAFAEVYPRDAELDELVVLAHNPAISQA